MWIFSSLLRSKPSIKKLTAEGDVVGLINLSGTFMKGKVADIRNSFVDAFLEIGEQAIDPLISHFNDDANPEQRLIIATTLCSFLIAPAVSIANDDPIIKILIDALKDPDILICEPVSSRIFTSLVRAAFTGKDNDVCKRAFVKLIKGLGATSKEANSTISSLLLNIKTSYTDSLDHDLKDIINEAYSKIFQEVAGYSLELKNGMEQLLGADDRPAIRQMITEMSKEVRAKAVLWVPQNGSMAAQAAATLSLLMYDKDPIVHDWASEALWKLLLSKAPLDKMRMIEQLTEGMNKDLRYGAAVGMMRGLMRSVLGRELKPGEMENARRLVEEHVG